MPLRSEVVVLPWVVSLGSPCSVLPWGAGSVLRIDVNQEKVTLISQHPTETSSLHNPPRASGCTGYKLVTDSEDCGI